MISFLQIECDGITILVYPTLNSVRCIYPRSRIASENYTIPEFVEILNRVRKWKRKRQ